MKHEEILLHSHCKPASYGPCHRECSGHLYMAKSPEPFFTMRFGAAVHPQVVFTMSKRILKFISSVATQTLMVLTALSAEAAPTNSCLLTASPGACCAGAGSST